MIVTQGIKEKADSIVNLQACIEYISNNRKASAEIAKADISQSEQSKKQIKAIQECINTSYSSGRNYLNSAEKLIPSSKKLRQPFEQIGKMIKRDMLIMKNKDKNLREEQAILGKFKKELDIIKQDLGAEEKAIDKQKAYVEKMKEAELQKRIESNIEERRSERGGIKIDSKFLNEFGK